jgi:hypothetical protein
MAVFPLQEKTYRLALREAALDAYKMIFQDPRDQVRYRNAAPMIGSVRLKTRELFAQRHPAEAEVNAKTLTTAIRDAVQDHDESRR